MFSFVFSQILTFSKLFFFRLTEANSKNNEKDERLTKLDRVLKNLENKVPTKETIKEITEKAAQVCQAL
jgi:hypothetical protein